MLTLVGPGGVGKTRVAVQAAAGLDAHFEEVVFVDFTPLTDASLGMPLLGTTLGVVEDGASPLTSRLASALAKRQILLVLDNLERILEIGPDLTALLRACPGVTVLATSRAPLRVSGEQEFPVPPLDLPDAIALFLARAQAVRPSLAATPESEPMLAAVCHELDRLPLAIELAAARAKVLSLEAMLSRLEYRLALLTGGPLDSPGRQRTLRDAIAWSYDLLDEDDQRRFRRLAVFAGGFTLEAFERVVEFDAKDTANGLDSIASLVDKNLVRVFDQSVENSGTERFGLLETIREFALERLVASEELEACRDRHAAWCVEFVERAEPQMSGADGATWMRRIDAEVPNLRLALEWLEECKRPDEARRLASAPWLYWLLCGRLREGRSWLDTALAIPGGSAILRARTIGVTGYLASNQGDFEYGPWVEREGLAAARQHDDPVGEAIALLALGDMACEQNDHVRASELMNAAIALCDELGDSARATIAIYDLGSLYRRIGDEEQAEALLSEVVRRGRDEGFGLAQAFGLNLMSRIERARGHVDRARAMYLESLELAERLGHRLAVAFILLDGATLATDKREPERAARLLGAAEALREAIGLTREPSVATADGVSYKPILAQIQTTLGAEQFDAAWNAGRSLSLDQAIAEAKWDDEVVSAPEADHERVAFGLTARELEVLSLLVMGQTDRQIGETLFISPRTAQVHVANILAKLDVPTRGAAAATALRHGLFTEPAIPKRPLPRMMRVAYVRKPVPPDAPN